MKEWSDALNIILLAIILLSGIAYLVRGILKLLWQAVKTIIKKFKPERR